MKTIYIVDTPWTDFGLDYYRLCNKNKNTLATYGLHYMYTSQVKNLDLNIQCNITAGLSNTKDGTDINKLLKDELSKFEAWAQQSSEDILFCLPYIGLDTTLCRILSSGIFPCLSHYKIQVVQLYCNLDIYVEGMIRTIGVSAQQTFEEIVKSWIASPYAYPALQYEKIIQASGQPPRILFIDDTQGPDAPQFFQALDRNIPAEELTPLCPTSLADRHSARFRDYFKSISKLDGGPNYEEISTALQNIGVQSWSDMQTWMPPSLLAQLRQASSAEISGLSLHANYCKKERPTSSGEDKDWHPYEKLPEDIRIRLFAKLMQTESLIRSKMEKASSCRWQYEKLSSTEKKFFPNPNTPQKIGKEPILSVLTLANNHATMIAENIESILAQKTTFPIQHIIVDNGSTDGTKEVITSYAKKYPTIIPILLSDPASKGENLKILFEQCRSTYAALCDGDDYFTDPDKLQTQVNFLERNPNCSICFHPVNVVYEDGSPSHLYPPDTLLPGGVKLLYTLRDLLSANFIQTNSVVYRWRFRNGLPDWFDPSLLPGDWYWHLLHAETGAIGYLRKPMSAYRRHAASLYALAEKDHVAHRHRHGLQELRMYTVCNTHFHGQYFKEFCRLARGVFADFVQDYLKTKDDGLLQEGIAAAPEFARDFLSLLASQNMYLPLSKG